MNGSFLANRLIATVVFSGTGMLYTARFTIAERGACDCTIIIGHQLTPSEETAVRGFEHFISEICGADIPTYTLAETPGGNRSIIVIGYNAVKSLCPEMELESLAHV